MTEEPLFQEETNAHVQKGSGKPEEGGALASDSPEKPFPQGEERPLNEDQLDALGEFFNIAMGRAATVLSTILGRHVDITTPRVVWANWKDVVSSHPVPCVVVMVQIKEGLEGSTVLVLSQRDANLLANIMDEEERDLEEPLDEYRRSVVGEAVNQMVGGAVYTMSEMLGLEMSIHPPHIEVFDFSAEGEAVPPPSYGEGDLVQISFEFRVADLLKSEMLQLMPVSFAVTLADMILEEEGEFESSWKGRGGMEPSVGGESFTPAGPEEEVEVRRAEFQPLGGSGRVERSEEDNIRLLLDIELEVSVEIGRTRMRIKDVLSLGEGSIIELDKVIGEPVEIYANKKLIARGEVVVIDEDFGVRITEIVRKQV